jgi:hypothetical protein
MAASSSAPSENPDRSTALRRGCCTRPLTISSIGRSCETASCGSTRRTAARTSGTSPEQRAVAAQREAERVLRVVLVAQVDLRPAVLVDVVVPRVLHDADDAERVVPKWSVAPTAPPVGKNCRASVRSITASRTPRVGVGANARPARTRMPSASK